MAKGEAHRHNDRKPAKSPGPWGRLTVREWEVLQLLAEGKSNKEIARQLGFTIHAAKSHVSHVLGKLEVGSRTEAAILYVRKSESGAQNRE